MMLDSKTMIKIGAAEYKVVITDDEEHHGRCIFGQRRIELNPDSQTKEALANTTLHEVLHALDMELGLGLKHRQIYGLTGALMLLIKENPRLIEYLVSSVQPQPSKRPELKRAR